MYKIPNIYGNLLRNFDSFGIFDILPYPRIFRQEKNIKRINGISILP